MEYENNGHWESLVECLSATTLAEVSRKLNGIYVGRFVGTQVFREGDGWSALVYYKTKASQQAAAAAPKRAKRMN